MEIRLSEWFQNMVEETGIKDIVFSGGVANNVKANKKIVELDCVNSLFVPPAPGDENLSIGAAFKALYNHAGPKKAQELIFSEKNAYWGNKIDTDDLYKFTNDPFILKNYHHNEDFHLSLTAEIIAGGNVVAICIGKMEFGSRALGHRSLIADPSNPASAKKINDIIKKRDFWMPFAPSILDECFDDYVINLKEMDSLFMTSSFDTTEEGRAHLKAAIHPYDHTVRPHRVLEANCPVYYKLIKEFKKKTGIGALLNTSLNLHGKPIVMNPSDLLKEIIKEKSIFLKYILIENNMYIRKE